VVGAMNWKMLGGFWQAVGSALIVLVLANVILHVVFSAWYPQPRGQRRTWESFSDVRRAAYAGMTPAEVNDLLDWTWRRPGFVYEQQTSFHEAPRSSRFVNVSAQGIRLTTGAESDLSKADLARTVLLFGGSTMFGYGLSDGQTIAAHLQARLPQYNFVNLGRAYYYSAQENIFLLRLLQSGHKIRYAAFLDGLNERCDFVVYQPQLEQMFNEAQVRRPAYAWDWKNQVVYPMRWLAARLRAKMFGEVEAPPVTLSARLHALDCSDYGNSIRLRDVTAQNMKARAALCDAFGIACVTFVQPFAGVNGLHLEESSLSTAARRVVKAKYEELAPLWKETGAIDISNALDVLPKHAYVDNVHYSNEASGIIAQKMLPALSERFGWR